MFHLKQITEIQSQNRQEFFPFFCKEFNKSDKNLKITLQQKQTGKNQVIELVKAYGGALAETLQSALIQAFCQNEYCIF